MELKQPTEIDVPEMIQRRSEGEIGIGGSAAQVMSKPVRGGECAELRAATTRLPEREGKRQPQKRVKREEDEDERKKIS